MNVCGTARLFRGRVLEVHGSLSGRRCCLCDESTGRCSCGEEYKSPDVRWDGETLPMEQEARQMLEEADRMLVVGVSDRCLSVWEWMTTAFARRSYAGKDCVVYQVDPAPLLPLLSPPVRAWIGDSQDFTHGWTAAHRKQSTRLQSGLNRADLDLALDEKGGAARRTRSGKILEIRSFRKK